MGFQITSNYLLQGDQPQAVDELVGGIREGHRFQTLLAATESGETSTMANVIQRIEPSPSRSTESSPRMHHNAALSPACEVASPVRVAGNIPIQR